MTILKNIKFATTTQRVEEKKMIQVKKDRKDYSKYMHRNLLKVVNFLLEIIRKIQITKT